MPTNQYEVSVAFLAERHLSPRLTGFADVGGGMLGMLPVHRGATARDYVPGHFLVLVPSYLSRPLGVGRRWRRRPPERQPGTPRGVPRPVVPLNDYGQEAARQPIVSSQPTVSLLYRFGARH